MKRRDILLASLGILVIWQVAAMIVDRPILPTPVVVLDVFFKELRGELPGPLFGQPVARGGGDAVVGADGGPCGAGNWWVQKIEPHLLPRHLFALPHSESSVRADRAALPGQSVISPRSSSSS